MNLQFEIRGLLVDLPCVINLAQKVQVPYLYQFDSAIYEDSRFLQTLKYLHKLPIQLQSSKPCVTYEGRHRQNIQRYPVAEES